MFSSELSERPQIVVANKCDLVEDEQIEEIRTYFEGKGYKFFPIMAAIAEGTKELIDCVGAELAKLPPIKRYEPDFVQESIVAPKKNARSFKVALRGGIYYIEDAEWLLDIMNRVDPDDYESLQYFERTLRSTGIIKALEDAGIVEGDTVKVYDVEFDYVP